MLTKRFWVQALERAIKTAAQAVLLTVGADLVNALSLDPVLLAGYGLGGFLLSLLTSVATAPIGADKQSPSVV